MSELILAIIGTIMFGVPLIGVITICNKTCKELNDSFEKEKQLWEEYYELELDNWQTDNEETENTAKLA